MLGWDSNDQLYDNVSFTGWHTAFPDAQVRLLPETCRALPLEGNMLLFLGEFAGHAEQVCPRATLRRVLERAAALGYVGLRPPRNTSSSCSTRRPTACARRAIGT